MSILMGESSSAAKLPADIVTLDCWLRGDDANSIFPVEISRTKAVYDLRKAIKNEKQVDFRDVDAHRLTLYAIPAPDDDALEEDLRDWTSDGGAPLKARSRLSELNLSGSLVIVDVPNLGTTQPSTVVLDMTFRCWVRGREARSIFPVEISRTKAVYDLRKAIKNEKQVDFRNIDADHLTLYLIPIPEDYEELKEHLEDWTSQGNAPLTPLERLSELNTAGSLVVVDVPNLARSHAGPESSTSSFPLYHVAKQRSNCLQKNGPVPPSDGGETERFAARQNDPDKAMDCGRPSSTSPTIPVTLLHPVFCRFHEDCETYECTPADNAFAQALSEAMSDFYSSKSLRAENIRGLFEDQGLHFVSSYTPDNCKTDGELSVNGHRYALLEVKNEVACSGADPFNQACLYYIDATRSSAVAMEGGCIPCMIVLCFGPYIAFAGAAWNLCPVVQIFSVLPMHYHATDTRMRIKVARHLGALKKAILSLEEVYRNIAAVPAPLSPYQPQLFPYPTQFTSLPEETRQVYFRYTVQLFQEKLLFHGTIPTEKRDICIKFVRRYSKEAHELCASWGCAPTLLGFETMPAGWFMVVMEKLDPQEYFELRTTTSTQDPDQPRVQPPTDQQMLRIRKKLDDLHQEGYVHGDVRDTNILLSKTDPETFMFVDFDWAGVIGEVRYPINANRGPGLWRPERAVDGELILADDDMAMWSKIKDRVRAFRTNWWSHPGFRGCR